MCVVPTHNAAHRWLRAWSRRLGITRPVRRERASIWNVLGENGRPGCSLVGVILSNDGAPPVIVHTRRLSEEDIHELLHVLHPDWSEAAVVAETTRRLTGRTPLRRRKMAFSVQSKKSGVTYYLHAKTTPTKSGDRTLHFFSKEPKEGALDALPPGYTVTEAPTGLPLLKKKAA